jgi:hypothetical protein
MQVRNKTDPENSWRLEILTGGKGLRPSAAKVEVMVTRGPLSQDTTMLDSQGIDTASSESQGFSQ